MDKGVRIRYGRTQNRIPKNTLVTVKGPNDEVYFGIARCNPKHDVFIKSVGSYIAHQRAEVAKEDDLDEYSTYVVSDDIDFKLHRSGLRGIADVESVKQVVNYFKDIDQYSLSHNR